MSFLIVKRHEHFFIARGTDFNVLAIQACVVKRVHGLTVFKHNVVGNIYDVIDGTHTGSAQSHTKPQRRRLNFYILYDTRTVTEAFLRILDCDVDIIVDVSVGFFYDGSGDASFSVEACRSFSCETDNGETVGTVGSNFKLNCFVAHSENVNDIVTGLVSQLGICVEDENAVSGSTGHIVERQSKLFDGAEHTFGDHAAELAGFDFVSGCKLDHSLFISGAVANGNVSTCEYVLCRSNDLQSLFAAINLTNNETFCIGMLFYAENQTDSYAADLRTAKLVALNLGARIRHSVTIFFDINIRAIHKIGKPIHRQYHKNSLSFSIKTDARNERRFHTSDEGHRYRVLPW